MKLIDNGLGENIFKNVNHYFNNADINFANLESVLSTCGVKDSKQQLVWGSSKSADVLKRAGFNAFSLANNHIFDYGYEGFEDSIQNLNNHGINFFGAGKNLAQSRQPLIIESNGLTVAFLGYVCKTTSGRIAKKEFCGSPALKFAYVKEDLKKLGSNIDVKIISLHWGFEQYHYPSPKQIKLAHRIIEAGADLIIGHHPHVIQGYEIYQGKPIFYSLGNFIFDDIITQAGGYLKWHDENKESTIAKLHISKNKVEIIDIIPVRLSEDLQLKAINGNEKEVLLNKINDWSQAVIHRGYDKFWKNLRIENELRGKKTNGEFKNIVKNIYKVRLRHFIYLVEKLRSKKTVRFMIKHLLIRLGFNPSQYY